MPPVPILTRLSLQRLCHQHSPTCGPPRPYLHRHNLFGANLAPLVRARAVHRLHMRLHPAHAAPLRLHVPRPPEQGAQVIRLHP